MDYFVLLSTVAKMTILISIGAILAYFRPLTDSSKKLMIHLLMNMALPSIIFSGFIQIQVTSELFLELGLTFLIAVTYMTLAMIISGTIAKRIPVLSDRSREVAFLSAMGNTGLVGIPLSATLFGPMGAVYASLYDAGTTIILFTVATIILQGQHKITVNQLKSFINTPMIVTALGIIVIFFEINIHPFIKDTTNMLAGTAAPLALIYMGMLLTPLIQMRKKIPILRVAFPASMKLILFPLALMGIFMLLPPPLAVKQAVMVQVALPNITTATVFFSMYKRDEEMGVVTSTTTIVLSLITIPIFLYIAQMLVL